MGAPRVPSHGIPWAPKGPLPWDPLGSQGSPPMGSLGLPRVPLPWGVRDPLPWDPLGSQGFPLPWVPSHGIPLGSQGSPPMGSHPTSPSIFVRPGRILTTKELTRGFLARSHIDTIELIPYVYQWKLISISTHIKVFPWTAMKIN